jgi:hypothetical protein
MRGVLEAEEVQRTRDGGEVPVADDLGSSQTACMVLILPKFEVFSVIASLLDYRNPLVATNVSVWVKRFG